MEQFVQYNIKEEPIDTEDLLTKNPLSNTSAGYFEQNIKIELNEESEENICSSPLESSFRTHLVSLNNFHSQLDSVHSNNNNNNESNLGNNVNLVLIKNDMNYDSPNYSLHSEEDLKDENNHAIDEVEPKMEYKWSTRSTKFLIYCYEKYYKQVGTAKIRTKKQMWKIIATEISKDSRIKVTASNCENRWRVLERNYKQFLEHQNTPGKGRKFFEFEEEMCKIKGKKRTVFPEVLLSSSSTEPPVTSAPETAGSVTTITVVPDLHYTSEQSSSSQITEENKEKTKQQTLKRRNIKRKLTIMERIRHDKLQYYDRKLKLENEKIDLLREKNELMKERNEILKQKQCCCTKDT